MRSRSVIDKCRMCESDMKTLPGLWLFGGKTASGSPIMHMGQRKPTIDSKCLPGDVARILGGQKDHRTRDIDGVACATKRNKRILPGCGPPDRDPARRDGVHTDTIFRKVHSHFPHQHLYP